MNVLVLGGTRFFGKELVEKLIFNNISVSIATRGLTPDSFGANIQRYKIERADYDSMSALSKKSNWDVVIDQICYSPNEARISTDVFRKTAKKYILTSTASVYSGQGEHLEEHYNPLEMSIKFGERTDFDYSTSKRLAEAVFFQRAEFPVVAMRIPIVLGRSDYTKRLDFHIQKNFAQEPIFVPNMDAETSFISSTEAADFLFWLTTQNFKGPINACSNGTIRIKEILSLIESYSGKKFIFADESLEGNTTPLTGLYSSYVNNLRASNLGFKFQSLKEWLSKLIENKCDL
ncbi:NAD-dependent epimerase/dehydratase family protein [bacterium]|nr:NAD-dependent epimerase/dehydratase family protein [bacterium]